MLIYLISYLRRFSSLLANNAKYMSQIKHNLESMLDMVRQGNPLEAIKEYYADDVVMIQPDGSEVHGKDEILSHEEQFFNGITEMREFEVYDHLVSGSTSFDLSRLDVSHEQMGDVKMRQVSMMEWTEDGKVSRVQFYPES